MFAIMALRFAAVKTSVTPHILTQVFASGELFRRYCRTSVDERCNAVIYASNCLPMNFV